MQVVNALIKAQKDFDLLYVPGGGHGAGGEYGRRRLLEFFVHTLQGQEPPNFNETTKPETASGNNGKGANDEQR